MKNPYENLMFWVITQDPSLPHIGELMQLISDAALQEARIKRLEDQLRAACQLYAKGPTVF